MNLDGLEQQQQPVSSSVRPGLVSRGASMILIENESRDIRDFYTLGKRIGEPGNFGYAVVGTHKQTGVKWAVKVINKSNFKNEDRALQNFRNEIRVMHSLKHKNIIQLNEVFEDASTLFIVMELCEGGELFERIQVKGSYSERDARDVIKQLLGAIAHMHSKGVAHCDLKPDNFLFLKREGVNEAKNPTPGSQQIKLIDFGLSKFMKSRRHYLTSFCGTAYYVAPEVLKKKYNHNCDCWSIGVVMFVLLYGFPPFYADRAQHRSRTDELIFSKISKGFFPRVLPGYGAFFPKDLPISAGARDLISKLLQTDVSKRLTAEEALHHPWIEGEVASAVPLHSFVLSSLQTFSGGNKFQQKVLHMLTKRLPESELLELKASFTRLDLDNDGSITLAEFKSALLAQNEKHMQRMLAISTNDASTRRSRTMSVEQKEDEIKKVFDLVDADKSGHIDFEELLMAYVHKKITAKEERLFEVFVKMDTDASGMLSFQEIVAALKAANIDLGSGEDIAEMVRQVDVDNSGQIDYEEFLSVMWKQSDDNTTTKKQTASSTAEEVKQTDASTKPPMFWNYSASTTN